MPQVKVSDYTTRIRKTLTELEVLEESDIDEAVELLHKLSDEFDDLKSYWGVV